MTIEWFTPKMTGTELQALAGVLQSGFINDGPITEKFEKQIADISGRSYAVAVPSGTLALTAALLAAGIRPGDKVIVPDLTFLATANAVVLAGGVPNFADVSRENFGLTVEGIHDAWTPGTRFVMPVEVNGRPVHEEVYNYCAARGVYVISDSCEAFGNRAPADALASCYSFSPNKFCTTGQGGAIVTNSPALHKRLLELKHQGFPGRSGTIGNETPKAIGFNLKFTDIQAAIGLEQLHHLTFRMMTARKRDNWYRHELYNLVQFPNDTPVDTRLWADILTDKAVPLSAYLAKYGVGTRHFWFPMHLQPVWRSRWAGCKFPNTMISSAKGLWLPSSYDITENQVAIVCDTIRAYFHG